LTNSKGHSIIPKSNNPSKPEYNALVALPISADGQAVTFEPGTHVRSLNAIYRALGVGRIQKVRDHQCKVEYNPSVFSRPPHRSINYIQALADLESCPTPLELAQLDQWGEGWKFDMRQMAARFLTLNKGGQLSNARTEILPHQIFTAYSV